MDNEELILSYAKKIYGFAYSKTNNTHNAEDLSQEILLQLFDKHTDFSDIDNMDAYVYRICCYTWSNYLRKNKPAWNMLGCGEDTWLSVASDENIEQEYIDRELYEKLRREIMYLSRMRRDITIMYYYENKSGDEIAKILGIPSSTVRWHMRETKTILKERIEMNVTDEIYKPVRLNVGINGQGDCCDMNGLTSDLIMQNICVICREKPLSAEEIARKLSISTFYLDEKIEKLLYMDFLREVRSNKYQTNFFIEEPEYRLSNLRFSYNNTMRIALPLYNIAKAILPGLRASGILVGEFSDDFLMYSIMMELTNNYLEDINKIADKKMGLSWSFPKRMDGSRYFVSANFRWLKEANKYTDDNALIEFARESNGNGISRNGIQIAESLQYFMKIFGGWRDFGNNELNQLMRVYSIIKNNETPNDYDKEMIAGLCEQGYVRVEKEMPIILVPMIKTGKELDELRSHLEIEVADLKKKLDMEKDSIVDLVIKHRKSLEKQIPAYIDKNEHDFLLSTNSCFSYYAVIYELMKNGYLYTPSEDEKKRICTLIYLK